LETFYETINIDPANIERRCSELRAGGFKGGHRVEAAGGFHALEAEIIEMSAYLATAILRRS
jgi:hypothetical protein